MRIVYMMDNYPDPEGIRIYIYRQQGRLGYHAAKDIPGQ